MEKSGAMNNLMKAFFGLILVVLALPAQAYYNPNKGGKEAEAGNRLVSLREDCSQSRSSTDMDINNVRARLLGGGDVWWDLRNGRYIVPKVDPASGETEVSAIFAGSVWLGGLAPGNNLKVAAQTYRSSGNDFWPGPLVEATGGSTNKALCEQWDRHFKVNGVDIDRHLQIWSTSEKDDCGRILDEEQIARISPDVLYWPAYGNPRFVNRFGFELPDNANAGLADFFDVGGPPDPITGKCGPDGKYQPEYGDYPKIGIRGCEDDPRYPDQMVFWIYNDAGGIHTQTQSPEPLRMEVQVQAFAYATNDEVNDMTFQRYRLINRGTQPLDSTFFAMWTDPDLGCYVDDYIGCDTATSLMYVYNEDALDGQPGCNCPGGVPTYCDKIPILGIDYFRGPLDLDVIVGYDTIIFDGEPIAVPRYKELGMSSFTYYNNGGVGNWPAAMVDPVNFIEYYRYMTGSWRDGTPFTYGGSGYNVASLQRIKYAFTEAPNETQGWSMCTANLDFGDRRTLQASGPFQLKPGAINELIIGVVFVPEETYPCPSLDRLLFADGIAQALFDNCFRITDGPDAPNMDWIELDQEIIAVLTNEPDSTFRFNNNAFEAYSDLDLRAPTTIPEEERTYLFEGYKIYQLESANVSLSELNNPERARLVYQVDIQNGISKIYNWRENRFPGISEVVWLPTLMVDGADQGVRHTFKIREDLFSKAADRKLINHRDYYYTVVAYAHNSYGEFLPSEPLAGQRSPYLEGRRNVRVYKVTPRPITDVVFNSEYGDGFIITRLDGRGAGGNFLDLLDDQYDRIFDPADTLRNMRYKAGFGPVQVRVFNPFAVKNGTYRLFTEDPTLGNGKFLTKDATWRLEYEDSLGNVVVNYPDFGLVRFNEQVFRDFGIAISIGQTANPGAKISDRNGLLGGRLDYRNASGIRWWDGMVDEDPIDFIPTQIVTRPYFFDQDPRSAFSTIAGVNSTWYPYVLCDFEAVAGSDLPLISPAWVDSRNNQVIGGANKFNALDSLNNVDIVFTSDRSKWSRCVVVESANSLYSALPKQGTPSQQFQLRKHPSLRLMPDANGNPVYDPDTLGMSWFPGYAIDVETGHRLNIFFGENSVFYPEVLRDLFPGQGLPLISANGRDMIWNPTSETILQGGNPSLPITNVWGGQHTIYVSRDPYDGCDSIRIRLNRPGLQGLPTTTLRRVTWTSIPLLQEGTSLRSFADGLIPNDLVVKLRVDRAFEIARATLINNRLPAYEWVIEGAEAESVNKDGYPELLSAIDVVPNPYYGLSYYENNEFATTVKITNLPAMATVNIYTLDGKFIRRFDRNETGILQTNRQNSAIRTTQIIPNLEWDLKNEKGIPVASGIYLIHVEVPGVGSRTLKWFGVQRQFDPSKL
jgi:hypothetical protein